MADGSESKGLTALNSATLGAAMPEITLPDGSKVQTGTIGYVSSSSPPPPLFPQEQTELG